MKYHYVIERILDYFPDLEPDYIAGQLRHCSFVSLDKRYMYYEVPKAACTQMKEVLRTVEGAPPIKLFTDDTWETRRDMFIHGRSNVPLPSLVDLDDQTQQEVLESPDFLRMTVVRNPYTRLISAWRNRVLLCEPFDRDVYLKVKGGLPGVRHKSLVSFEEFLEYVQTECDLQTCDPHWRLQVDHIFHPALNFSYIAKLKNLDAGLHHFEQHLGISDSLPADGKNASAPVGSAAYTPELAEKVYGLYRPDFEILGYKRDAWIASRKSAETRKTGVSEERFLDEVIERNVVILRLFEERRRMEAQLRCLSWLHMLWFVNALLEYRSKSRNLARKVKQWWRGMLTSTGGAKHRDAASA